MRLEGYFRLFGMLGFAFGGWRLAILIDGVNKSRWILVLTVVGVIFGLTATPYFTNRLVAFLYRKIRESSPSTLLVSAMGLVVTFILASLMTAPLSMLPGIAGRVAPIVALLVLGLICMWVVSSRGNEILKFLGLKFAGKGLPETADSKILVDTSAIIDGRIADIGRAGFVRGSLLVPRFVLAELQRIADSPDPIRRNRGRRGLEMLKMLQKEPGIPLEILDIELDGAEEVDHKLVTVAKSMQVPIITNDFNLNRVAELQGLKVLNINELANAVKPVVLPGEEMEVRIIQEGKEAGQGVGFLDDGTMVVVDGGRRYLSTFVDIVVTRVLQTAAGRMIFAQLKNGSRT